MKCLDFAVREYELGSESMSAAPARPRAKWRADAPPVHDALSPREHQAVSLLHTGLTRKEVAYEMGLSDTTVRVLLYRAQRKARQTP